MKKIIKSLFAIIVLLPCVMLFAACGKLKSLDGDTFVYLKTEVTGSLKSEDFEDEYKTISFEFEKSTMIYKDGSNEDSFEYKIENDKVYLKAEGGEFSTEAYAEISGKYIVVTEIYDEGTVKVYFKAK